MVKDIKSWFGENQTLILFLGAQAVALATAAAAILAYSVKLETRVSIMETRGAEYSVARMAKMEERITVLEQQVKSNEAQLLRVVNEFLRDRSK
jgi:hypothetical protein